MAQFPSLGHEFIASLMDNDEYSDLTFVCDDREIKAHKAIVCPQSSVLAKACRPKFEEGFTGKYKVEKFDGETVSRMIQFLYTKDYSTEKSEHVRNKVGDHSAREPRDVVTEGSEQSDEFKDNTTGNGDDEENAESALTGNDDILLRHVLVNAIADYFNISGLCTLSLRKIEKCLRANWHAETFLDLINTVFDLCGNQDIYHLMSTVAAEHIDELVEEKLSTRYQLPIEFLLGLVVQAQKLDKSREILQELEIEVAKEETARVKRDAEIYRRCVEQFHDRINGMVFCRNESCRPAKSSIRIETRGTEWAPAFDIRCLYCGCKH